MLLLLGVALSLYATDNHNPNFVRPIIVSYHFETQQPLRVVVFDEDKPNKPLAEQDLIGETMINLADIITAPGMKVSRALAISGRTGGRGQVRLTAERVHADSEDISLKFCARKLDKKDLFGSSDPFLVIHRIAESGEAMPVAQTSVIKKNINPSWPPIVVTSQELCNGDASRPLRLVVFDWNKSGSHEYIGECDTTLTQLKRMAANSDEALRTLSVVNKQLSDKKRAKHPTSGSLIIESLLAVPRPTFIDYLEGGLEISLVVAVDWTASNGDPRSADSLHFLGPQRSTPYSEAIRAVGAVLAPYDHDGAIPAYGFGGNVPDPAGRRPPTISHCFPLNGQPAAPEVRGLDGVLRAYFGALQCVALSGPTLFAELIETTAAIAMSSRPDEQKYVVLLIVTDGTINDTDATIAAVIAASRLPMSIVIVGVGAADFSAMHVLDSDSELLKSTDGRLQAARDIVQFVEFSRFRHAPEALAAETLAELPNQVVEYFRTMNVPPRPARTAPASMAGGADASLGFLAPAAAAGPASSYAGAPGSQVGFLPPAAFGRTDAAAPAAYASPATSAAATAAHDAPPAYGSLGHATPAPTYGMHTPAAAPAGLSRAPSTPMMYVPAARQTTTAAAPPPDDEPPPSYV